MNVGYDRITSRPPVFAQILREQGKLTQEHLDEALERQWTEKRYVGEILCEITSLKGADIARALGLQELLRL